MTLTQILRQLAGELVRALAATPPAASTDPTGSLRSRLLEQWSREAV